MQTSESVAVTQVEIQTEFIHWTPVVAGALVAAAFSLILVAFGAAIGLSVASTAPTWRDASSLLAALSGLFLLLSALVSFGFGGYIAGRLRRSWGSIAHNEWTEFRDGAHGLISWALAVVLSVVIAAAVAAATAPRATTSPSQAATTVGENLIAYDLDRLFRSDRRGSGDMAYARAEASRILLASQSREGMKADDRGYLSRVVASQTGISQPDADRRLEEALAATSTAVKKARQSAVMAGFSIAVALLLGAVAAWYASRLGGQHRDQSGAPLRWDLARA